MALVSIDALVADRTRLIKKTDHWRVHNSVSLDTFLAAVAHEQPTFLSYSLLKFLQAGPPSAEVRAMFEDADRRSGDGFDLVVNNRRPVVAYGRFFTRDQPANTVRIHNALALAGVPKETVLFSARAPEGRELVVYDKLSGTDYETLLRDMKWESFYQLGMANSRYARAGIALRDNRLGNWLFNGTQAIRIDVGAPEVEHDFRTDTVVFTLRNPLAPYTYLMTTLAHDVRSLSHPLERYNSAMTYFKRGFFADGTLEVLRRDFSGAVNLRRDLLAEKVGV